MLSSLQGQIDRVLEDYPDAQVTKQPDGSLHIEVSKVALPDGWNKAQTRVLVIVPIGYPTAKPDGLEADHDLRLANGDMPRGAGEKTIGETKWLHFCWQPNPWDHDRESLWRYIKFAESRFREK